MIGEISQLLVSLIMWGCLTFIVNDVLKQVSDTFKVSDTLYRFVNIFDCGTTECFLNMMVQVSISSTNILIVCTVAL